MASLKINTGVIALEIENELGEVQGVFRFNPNDITQAKNFLKLTEEFDDKQKEFSEREEQCTTMDEKMELLEEVVTYFTDALDMIYGKGSSQVLFGGAKTLTMFEDFFEGIIPYYASASTDRTSKYSK